MKKFDAAVILKHHGPAMDCFEIYRDPGSELLAILAAASDSHTEALILGFTPLETGSAFRK